MKYAFSAAAGVCLVLGIALDSKWLLVATMAIVGAGLGHVTWERRQERARDRELLKTFEVPRPTGGAHDD